MQPNFLESRVKFGQLPRHKQSHSTKPRKSASFTQHGEQCCISQEHPKKSKVLQPVKGWFLEAGGPLSVNPQFQDVILFFGQEFPTSKPYFLLHLVFIITSQMDYFFFFCQNLCFAIDSSSPDYPMEGPQDL